MVKKFSMLSMLLMVSMFLMFCLSVRVHAAADPGAYLEAGKKLAARGDWANAEKYLRAALQGDPQLVEAYVQLALVLDRLGRPQEAAEARRKAGAPVPGPRPSPVPAAASSFPQGSLVLFDESIPFGVLEDVKPPRNSARAERAQTAFGQMVLRLTFNPADVAALTLNMLPAWKASGLTNPGDIFGFGQGALVFWLRGRAEGDFFDVGLGMAEKPPATPDPNLGVTIVYPPERVVSTLPIRRYCWMGSDWQKVIIPLKDLPQQGYAWTYEKVMDGRPLGRRVRVPRRFDWKQVECFYLRAEEVMRPERVFEIDNLALVPSYDPAEAEALKLEASRRMLQSRRSQDEVVFDDAALAGFWTVPDDKYSYVVLDETTYKEGKKSAHFVLESFQTKRVEKDDTKTVNLPPQAGGGQLNIPIKITQMLRYGEAGASFPETDLSPIQATGGLAFWVKGKNGGEFFQVGLRCLRESVYHARNIWPTNRAAPDIRSYTEVTREWKHVIIPLADFPARSIYSDEEGVDKSGPFDWTRVTDLTFLTIPPNEAEWQWYMDDIRFLPQVPRKDGAQ